MKATTALVCLVALGLLLQLNGYDVLGSSIVKKISPYATDYQSMIVYTGGVVLSFGILLLGKSLPYKFFAIFMLSLLTLPISVVGSVGFPTEIKVLMGTIWGALMIQAVGGIFGGEL